MAQIPSEIKSIIDKFIIESKKSNIEISKLFIFGSYANGNFTNDSDIDIAVVSDDFSGNRFLDNRKLVNARLSTHIYLETHPFTTADFTEENPFVKEILLTGIRYQ